MSRIRNVLLRFVCPAISSICDRLTPSQSRNTSTSVVFARPSSGGALTATFSAPPCSPSTAFRFAPGCARTESRAPPSCLAIAIAIKLPALELGKSPLLTSTTRSGAQALILARRLVIPHDRGPAVTNPPDLADHRSPRPAATRSRCRFLMPGDEESKQLTQPFEQRRANAHEGRPFFDGNLKVPTHSH